MGRSWWLGELPPAQRDVAEQQEHREMTFCSRFHTLPASIAGTLGNACSLGSAARAVAVVAVRIV